MKRHLLIIAVCLVLGAVVNVAVAWGCAAWIRPNSPVDPDEARVSARRAWARYAPEGSPPFHEHDNVTRWGRTVTLAVSRSGSFVVGELRSGSPVRSFQCGLYLRGDGKLILFNGWRARSDSLVILPYEPIWPGFAVNTLFYAALLWLLIWGLSTLRHLLRLKRGLCPKCAYPMGESAVCTECGCELAKRVA